MNMRLACKILIKDFTTRSAHGSPRFSVSGLNMPQEVEGLQQRGVRRNGRIVDAAVRTIWMRADLTRAAQALEAGIALSALTRHAQRLGLPMRREAPDRRIPAALVRRAWLDPAVSRREAAETLGLAPTNLRRRAKALGLPMRARSLSSIFSEPHAEARFRAMWLANVRAADMAEHFGVHPMTVCNEARRMGLPRRRPPSRPISLVRYLETCREAELRASLAMSAKVEVAAVWGMWNEGDAHPPPRPGFGTRSAARRKFCGLA